MKKITMNGKMYLGDVDTKLGDTVLRNIMEVKGSLTDETFQEYIQREKTGTLEETIEVQGKNVTLLSSNLTEDEQLTVAIAKLVFERAKTKARINCIKNTYKEMLGE